MNRDKVYNQGWDDGVLEGRKLEKQRIMAEIETIENPYPLDLIAKPETEEGKMWKFGNRVWNNCVEKIRTEVFK